MAKRFVFSRAGSDSSFSLLSKWALLFGLVYFGLLVFTYKSPYYLCGIPLMYLFQRLTIDIKKARQIFSLFCLTMTVVHFFDFFAPPSMLVEPTFKADMAGIIYYSGLLLIGGYYFKRHPTLV